VSGGGHTLIFHYHFSPVSGLVMGSDFEMGSPAYEEELAANVVFVARKSAISMILTQPGELAPRLLANL